MANMTYAEMQAKVADIRAGRAHRITRPTRDLRGAAIYIERDGARMVSNPEATRLGLTMFVGPLSSGGSYSFTVADADIPALDRERDKVYTALRTRQLKAAR